MMSDAPPAFKNAAEDPDPLEIAREHNGLLITLHIPNPQRVDSFSIVISPKKEAPAAEPLSRAAPPPASTESAEMERRRREASRAIMEAGLFDDDDAEAELALPARLGGAKSQAKNIQALLAAEERENERRETAAFAQEQAAIIARKESHYRSVGLRGAPDPEVMGRVTAYIEQFKSRFREQEKILKRSGPLTPPVKSPPGYIELGFKLENREYDLVEAYDFDDGRWKIPFIEKKSRVLEPAAVQKRLQDVIHLFNYTHDHVVAALNGQTNGHVTGALEPKLESAHPLIRASDGGEIGQGR